MINRVYSHTHLTCSHLPTSINNKLQQREAASGVLAYAMKHNHANLVSLQNGIWFKGGEKSEGGCGMDRD